MKVTAIALIIASAIIGILAILGILSTNEYRDRITELEEINAAFKIENFEGGAAIIKVKEQADQIIELQVKEEMSELVKENLEYCLLYIKVMQLRMDQVGVVYPELIYDTILEDGYFEDLEEQVEFFEGVVK